MGGGGKQVGRGECVKGEGGRKGWGEKREREKGNEDMQKPTAPADPAPSPQGPAEALGPAAGQKRSALEPSAAVEAKRPRKGQGKAKA